MDRAFRLRMALMTGTSFAIMCATMNWADARLLQTHGGPLIYPLKHLVHLFALVIAVGVYVLPSWVKAPAWKVLLPAAWSATVGGLVAILNFGNLGAANYVLQVSVIVALASWARLAQPSQDRLTGPNLTIQAKIEWTRQTADFWRTVAISGTIALAGLAIPWMKCMWDVVTSSAKTNAEQRLLQDVFMVQGLVLFVCVSAGPIYECLANTVSATRLLLAPGMEGRQTADNAAACPRQDIEPSS